MGANYKAVPYTIDGEFAEFGQKETRYYIVSMETGEVLDDAQGYGYRTAQKAYAAYEYKTRDKSKDKRKLARKRRIAKWLKENSAFSELLEDVSLEIAKGRYGPDTKLDAKLVKKLLEESGLACEFSPEEVLKAWKEMK